MENDIHYVYQLASLFDGKIYNIKFGFGYVL